jgi:HSP20 family protein
MADIVKKSNVRQPTEWNPMRVMRELLNWDPFREMAPLAGFAGFQEPVAWNPNFDVTENKDAYVFKADLPGIKQEDLEISATGNRLQISGKREMEHETRNDTFYAFERQYGSFTRTFTLPEGADVDHARSDLKEGVLTLVIPKRAEAQARKIQISSGVKS